MDSIDDVPFDSRVISQSSTRKNSASPTKRGRVDDDASSEWSRAPFELEEDTNKQSNAAITHHFGEMIQRTAVPQVMTQVNDQFA